MDGKEEVKEEAKEEEDVKSTPSKVAFDDTPQSPAEGATEGDQKTPRQSRRQSAYVLAPGAAARRQSVRPGVARPDYLREMLKQKRASVRYLDKVLDHKDSSAAMSSGGLSAQLSAVSLNDKGKEALDADSALLKKIDAENQEYKKYFPKQHLRMEVRLADVNYRVVVKPGANKIKTVYNQSYTYEIVSLMKRIWKGEKREAPSSKLVLEGINLVLKPGKMYLLLGPPSSGKTTLLKAIAGRLSTDNGETVGGSVKYNGVGFKDDKSLHIENAIAFIDQLDRHAARLTVEETFEFAFQCVSHGTHSAGQKVETPEAQHFINKLDADNFRVKATMEALGLSHVAVTFVGDSDVRGVSGGQRRRVTVGEMVQGYAPVLCGDEISNGLDAASTYDMMRTFMHFTRLQKWTRIISLLQPSPETVSLFDEVLLLSEGKLIYAGPIHAVEDYFGSLGYFAPEHIDVADFLQMLSTSDAAQVFDPPPGSDRTTPYTASELAKAFRESEYGEDIQESLKDPWKYDFENERKGVAEDEETDNVKVDMSAVDSRYANRFARNAWLNTKRSLTLFKRDTRFLIVNAIKNLIMGASVGGVFWQTDDVVSILGVIFQGMLFIMLGAMVSAPGFLSERVIYYKQADANFFGPFSYVIGQSISLIPQALLDVFMFGTILYWMVGLAGTAGNFFIFIFVLFVFTLVMNQMLIAFAAVASTSSSVQAMSSVIMLLSMLFGGFIVAPDVIPNYYIWIYWWNPNAWAYRALVVNEFRSSDYDQTMEGSDVTKGDFILEAQGFTLNGEPFGQEWIGYSFAYMVPYVVLCAFLTGLGLLLVRVGENKGVEPGTDSEAEQQTVDEAAEINLPFTPVTLSFEGICYDVKASKGKETLRLLSNVNGIFEAGRMCALMGSSGAGKTTLMDVVALRKSTGTVAGDVRLNGFPQDPKTFRRCSGYVEQFDVQSPELTVRETVLFSARLRLDSSIPEVATDEGKQAYVDQVLRTLELTPIADCVVGSDEEGGLSFEQRKRLSIAVELAASPSLIFLDEPTTGLDARAASLVVKCLRRITNTGRTVCATIHQPSSSVFEMFDDLLLLKKGGRAVFFGELGEGSQNLVNYFEARDAEPIGQGENPADWMLKVIGAGTGDDNTQDYADVYESSEEYNELVQKVEQLKDSPDPKDKLVFKDEFAAPPRTRRRLLSRRLRTIYWRSPAYNYGRMVISLVSGFFLASVFLSNRKPDAYSETQLTSVISVIFISFIITGVLAMTLVLPVMLRIRDVFYIQEASGMLSYPSLALALGTAEWMFIVISGFAFCITFIPTMGIPDNFGRSVAFWGFFTFNLSIYSYFGQCFMCCVKTQATAQILASVFIGMNNFFSGLIVRPQFLSSIFQFGSWITPGRYVYEGLLIASFDEDTTPVVATPGSDFYSTLNCTETGDGLCEGSDCEGGECVGTADEFVDNFFGGEFGGDNRVWRNCLILGAFLIIARVSTFCALKYLRFTSS